MSPVSRFTSLVACRSVQFNSAASQDSDEADQIWIVILLPVPRLRLFSETHFLKYCLAIIWKSLWRCVQRTFWTTSVENTYVWVSFKKTTIPVPVPVPIPVRLKWWVLHSIPIMWIVAFSCVKSHHITANSLRSTVYLQDPSDCVSRNGRSDWLQDKP